MFIPKPFALTDPEVINQFIREYGFATLFTSDLSATRLPLILEDVSEKDGQSPTTQRLIGHMARANGQWKVANGQRVSVMFDGPHAYISPKWYQSRPAVPTWNYVSVQCFGTFSIIDDDQEARQAIETLLRQYEPDIIDDTDLMPDAYMSALRKAVVAFVIDIDEIQAVEKLGQQKGHSDQQGVYQALLQSLDNLPIP